MPNEIEVKNLKGPILENQPLAPLTTWKIGGAAQYLAAAAGLEEVYRLMGLAQDRGWPLWFLGRGSNILIDDAGLPGITLHLARSLQSLERRGDTLRAGAGVSLPRLARAAADLGFAGFEFLAGIPGTVGAAVRLNAGADGRDLAGVLNRVWVVTPRLQLLEFQAAELGLGYRASLLLNFPHWLVAEAEFILTTPAAPEIDQAAPAAIYRRPAGPGSPPIIATAAASSKIRPGLPARASSSTNPDSRAGGWARPRSPANTPTSSSTRAGPPRPR